MKLGVVCLLVCLLDCGYAKGHSWQESKAQLEFSASTNDAYEGQIVDLHLILSLPQQSNPYSVSIPWLTSSSSAFEWVLPAEQWLCQHALPQLSSLPLRWQQHLLYAPMVRPGEYELHWQIMILSVPENGQPLRFDAVSIEAMKSQPVVIRVHPRPSSALPATTWDLGVGSFQVIPSWQKSIVALGEEVMLQLAVRGDGDLSQINPPTLSAQTGWERDAYLLEPAPETWQDHGVARVFRYRVRPRRLGLETPPGLTVQFFDPKTNRNQTVRVRVPSLNVISSAMTNASAGNHAPDPQTNLTAFWRNEIETHEQKTDFRLLLSEASLIIPPIFMLFFIGRWLGELYFADYLARRRWRNAAQRAIRQFETAEVLETEKCKQILAQFLSCGLQRTIPADIESIQSAFSQPLVSGLWLPLVKEIQELDFGPNEYRRKERVLDLAKQFFLTMESDS